jgi:predicted ATPase/DNA-binding XRE family transcriptional regulator
MDSAESSFGALLKRLRVERRLSQEELAERAKLSVAAISALERGSRQSPYRSSVDLLADGLGVDAEARAQLYASAEQWRKARPLPIRSAAASTGATAPSTPNNLPLQLTSFIGRDREVAEIKKLLEKSRLVTLVGSGGVGKTRCAIEVGAEVNENFRDGVWLVELAPVSDGSVVNAEVARALGLRESSSEPLLETLLAHLKRRRLLVIFDSCERVIEQARSLASAILRSCPEVRLLVTSREILSISGERVLELPSLAVPPGGGAANAATALRYGSIALFADRASASDGRFELVDENARSVSDICRRLDGIPLAIELAAARVKVLSPQQLVQMLDERFRVLTSGDRSALPRHQTMRALIDWSYDVLSDDERALFRKLAVFAGGFTLATVSDVCGDERSDEIKVLNLLSSLVDKSLVQVDPAGDVARYRLLDSTREYAREKLIEAGEDAILKRAHAAAFLSLAEQFEAAYDATPDHDWFAQADLELENWRSALEWALAGREDVLMGQRLVGALRRIWSFLAAAEGRRWVRAARAQVSSQTPERVVALLELAEASLDASLLQYKGCQVAAERALAQFKNLNDPLGIAETLRLAGWALVSLGDVSRGLEVLIEALASARALNARKLTAAVIDRMADAHHRLHDFTGARALYAEALEIYKMVNADPSAMARITANLAEMEFSCGDAQLAMRLAYEALPVNRALHYTDNVTFNLCNIAAYLIALERYEEAYGHAGEALALACSQRSEVPILFSVQHLAAAAILRSSDPAMAREDYERAARVLGYVDARLDVLEALREYTEQQEYDKMLALLSSALAESLTATMRSGEGWSEEQAIAETAQLAASFSDAGAGELSVELPG